jgi:ketosteroid isomerase-like protein
VSEASGNVALVRMAMEAFERGDTEAQLSILADDVELVEWPEGPDQRTYRGHDGALRAYESWAEAWEWLRNDVDEIVEAGDRVLACGKTHGKGKGSAVEVAIDAFNVYTLRDGKIARIEFFITKQPALEAAGLSESAIKTEEAS